MDLVGTAIEGQEKVHIHHWVGDLFLFLPWLIGNL